MFPLLFSVIKYHLYDGDSQLILQGQISFRKCIPLSKLPTWCFHLNAYGLVSDLTHPKSKSWSSPHAHRKSHLPFFSISVNSKCSDSNCRVQKTWVILDLIFALIIHVQSHWLYNQNISGIWMFFTHPKWKLSFLACINILTSKLISLSLPCLLFIIEIKVILFEYTRLIHSATQYLTMVYFVTYDKMS